MDCMEQMFARLAVLQPVQIEIADDNHKHAGHIGARNVGGNYWLKIVSAQFTGKPTVARYRMVYSALREMLKQKREIHALHITASTPDEI